MAKTKLGANAGFSGPQLGLSTIGDHCYAYSGSKDVSVEATMLDFNTGKGYIIGRFEFNADFATGGGANLRVQIYMNDTLIVEERDTSNAWNAGDNEFHVVIPPLTKMTVKVLGGSQDANINFTGRVYE